MTDTPPTDHQLAADHRWTGEEALVERRAHDGWLTSRHPTWPELSFEDRMATARFDVDERAHIVVDGDVCGGCTTRACVVACPANLFVPTSDGGIVFNHELCFECGTCYLVCNEEGAISWSYPTGGHGVVFRRT